MMGKVTMNINRTKIQMNSLAIIIMLASSLMGCSKHNVTPTPPAPPQDTTAAYHDPVQYGTPFRNMVQYGKRYQP